MTKLEKTYDVWVGLHWMLALGVVLALIGLAGMFGPRLVRRFRSWRRTGRQVPTDQDLYDLAYATGVARSAHPFGERCVHGTQPHDECLDCPDGCPQVVA